MSIIFKKGLDTGLEVVQNLNMNNAKKHTTARNINALCDKFNENWYNKVNGIYTGVKTWGPETETRK